MTADERPWLDDEAVDRIGRRAGAELRLQPPAGAAQRAAAAGRRRRVTRRATIGATAIAALVATGAVVAAVRSSDDHHGLPAVTLTTDAVDTTVAPGDRAPRLLAPTSVPDGLVVTAAEAWLDRAIDRELSSSTWVRLDGSGAVTDRLTISARRTNPLQQFTPFASDVDVHGQPAVLATSPSKLSWSESGLRLSVETTTSDDVQALAERTIVDPVAGISLPGDAVPAGFELVPTDAGAIPDDDALTTSIELRTPDASRSVTVDVEPNRLGKTLDALGAPYDPRRRTIGDVEVVKPPSPAGVDAIAWIDRGFIVEASGDVDASMLEALVATVEPTDQAGFERLVQQAADTRSALPERDHVEFPDGISLSIRSSQDLSTAPSAEVAMCFEGDRAACVVRDPTGGGASGQLVGAVVAIGDHAEYVAYLTDPATEVRGLTDLLATEDDGAVPFDVFVGTGGVFVRAVLSDDLAALEISYTPGAEVTSGASGSLSWSGAGFPIDRSPRLPHVEAPAGRGPTTTAPPATPTTVATTTVPRTTAVGEDVDRLAGWPAAPVDLPTLDDVPLLRPAADPAVARIERGEWQPAPDERYLPNYVQYWVDPALGAELSITTRLSPDVTQQTGTPIDLPGWDSAERMPTGDGYTSLALRDPSGYVTVHGYGLPAETVEAIASSLTRRPAAAGWQVDTTGTGLVVVDDTWVGQRADRALLWYDDFGLVAELSVSFGSLGLDNGGGGERVGLAEIDGHLALTGTFEHASHVAWSPAPGVVVFAGHRGTLDETLAFARSLDLVDRAAWERGTVVRTDDGCASLFC